MGEPKPMFLLADADRVLARELAEYAREEGFEVIEAHSARDVLDALAHGRRPDAIVLELVMPGSNGLLRTLRMDRRISDVPIVIHTAPAPRLDAVARGIGAQKVVFKPSRPDTLLAGVRELAPRRTPAPSRTCVFVVDDHEDTRDMIAEAMAIGGIHAFKLGSGGAALALLRGVLPAVIFSDVQMPDMSGFELAQRVRALGLEVPIVAVTGHARTQPAGLFDAVVVKPFELAHLLALVRRLERAPS